MRSFSAQVVAAAKIEGGVYALVFVENRDGSGMRLELQGGPHDEQDVALGMDTYCLCTETGACHYGGIERWEIDERESCVRLVLDEEASDTLEANGGFRIAIRDRDTTIVRDSLPRIFSSSRLGLVR